MELSERRAENQAFLIHKQQKIDVDDTIEITATNKITLKVGEVTSITMEPNKITIESPEIETKSVTKTTVQGGAALDLLAGLIKING